MLLRAVARSFNKTPCNDGYTGDLAFYAQLGLYDDTKRDSETAERRVLSVDPDVEIPARRVIEAEGVRFIIGHGNMDTFRGDVVRMGYVAHEATHLATLRTLANLCKNEAGTTAWAGISWVKNMAYSEQDSHLNSFHHIHLSVTESVNVGHVITLGGINYIVRTTNNGSAGTLICHCDQMPEPVVETVSVGIGTYNPTTDTLTPTPTSVRAVRIRWQSLFEYTNKMAPKFGPGDVQIAFTKAAVPSPVGEKVTFSDGTWMVASADSYGDLWLCRGVHHA